MPQTNFSHYVDIVSSSATIIADITSPVVFIDLQRAPAAFWSNLARTDGGDIIVTSSDGATRYDSYVVFIDTVNELGLLAAEVPGLTAATDDTYRLYIGDAAHAAPATGATFGRDATFSGVESAFDFTQIQGSAPEIIDLAGNAHDGTLDNNSAFSSDTTSTAFWGRGVRLTRATSSAASVNLANAIGLDGDASSERTFIWAQVPHNVGNGNDILGIGGTNRLRNNGGNYLLRINATDYLGANANGPVASAEEVWALVYDGPNDAAELFKNGASEESATGVTEAWPSGGGWELMNAGGGSSVASDSTWYFALWFNSVLSDSYIDAIADMLRDNDTSFWTWGTVTTNSSPAMSRIYRDSDGDTLSTTPPNVTAHITGTGSITVETDANALETDRAVVLAHDGGARQSWTFDEFDGIENFNTVFRVKLDTISANAEGAIWWRVNGASLDNSYALIWKGTNTYEVWRRVSGSYSQVGTLLGGPTIVSNQYMYVGVSQIGDLMRIMVWTDMEDQPDEPQFYATDSTVTGAGKIGFGTFGTATFNMSVDLISLGNHTAGGAADHVIGVPMKDASIPTAGYLTADDTWDTIRWVTDGSSSKKSFNLIRRSGTQINSVVVHQRKAKILVAYNDHKLWEYDRFGLNGSEVLDNSANGAIENLAIAEDEGYVFYESNGAEIRRVDYGTWLNDQSIITQTFVGQIQVYEGLLWYYASGAVWRANLDGTSPTNMLAASSSVAFQLDDLYYYVRDTTTGLRRIERANTANDVQVSADTDFNHVAYNRNAGRIAWIDGTGDDLNDKLADNTDEQQRASVTGIYGETLSWFDLATTTVKAATTFKESLDSTIITKIWVTGDLTYDMSAYEDVEIRPSVSVEALPGYTNRPTVQYDTLFVDGTFKSLFRANTGSEIINLHLRGKHANDVAPLSVQCAVRFIGAGVTIRGCHVDRWCKWGFDLEVNQEHIIENNTFNDCWWDADNGLGYEFGGYGYAIWCRGALTTTPSDAQVTIIRNNVFNNCRNFIDAGSQVGNSVYVRNNVFGYASQAAMDSHGGGYYRFECSGNWFCNRRSGQSYLRLQDVQTGGTALIENNICADAPGTWYFGPTTSGLNENNALWDTGVLNPLSEPADIIWTTPGDYADITIRDNLFRQALHEFPYDEYGKSKVMGLRVSTSGLLMDFEGDSADDLLSVLPNSRPDQPNFTLNGTTTYTDGIVGRALSVPAGTANNATIPLANCDNIQMGTGPITVTIQARQTSTTVGFASLFYFGGRNTTDPGYGVFWKDDGNIFVNYGDGVGKRESDTMSTGFSLNSWQTLTVVFDRAAGEIRLYVAGSLHTTHTMTAGIAEDFDIQSIVDAQVGNGFQNDGAFDISFIHIRKDIPEDWEIAAYHNGGQGIKSKPELVLDNWDANSSDVIRQVITAPSTQIGGLEDHRAITLNVTEDQFNNIWKDSDEALAFSLNDPTVRFSVRRLNGATLDDGRHQVAAKINAITPNADPGSANIDIDVKLIDFHYGTNFMDGFKGNELTIWRGFPGATAVASDGPYGSDIVDIVVSSLTTEELETQTNAATPNTFWNSSAAPTYGDGSSLAVSTPINIKPKLSHSIGPGF